MKTKAIVLIAAIALVMPVSAVFETWINKEGKPAVLSLVKVTGEGEELTGEFVMRNGRKTSIKKANLSEESAKKLMAHNPNKPNAFDEVLGGNLVILDGEKFKAHTISAKPKKYYIFYYTASWCGPCKAFTPTLIKFYNDHKSDNFEIVLISSDRDKKSMESYAAKNKMPWPQLKFDKIGVFESKFNHEVRGIPSVIVCDLEGKIITNNGRDLATLEQLVK